MEAAVCGSCSKNELHLPLNKTAFILLQNLQLNQYKMIINMSRDVSSSKQELLSLNFATLWFLFPSTGHFLDLENSYNMQNTSYILALIS